MWTKSLAEITMLARDPKHIVIIGPTLSRPLSLAVYRFHGYIPCAGGGIIGCSIAYQLANRGMGSRVTLVEAVSVAHAASGKAGGFLARHWCDHGPLEQLTHLSFDMHGELAAKLGAPIGYRRLDTLSVQGREVPPDSGDARSSGKTKLKRRVQSSVKVPEWLDGAGVKLVEQIGTTDDTAQVTPALLTKALLESAVANGVTLRIACVEDVLKEGYGPEQRVVGVALDDGTVLLADVVVVAMGPWSGRAQAWFPEIVPVSGRRAHSVTMRPRPAPATDAVFAHALFMDIVDVEGGHRDPEVYPRPDGEVYVCGMVDDAPLPEHPRDASYDAAACDKLRSFAASVSSLLAPEVVVYEKEQACYLPKSGSDLPLIGPVPSCAGAYIATGHR